MAGAPATNGIPSFRRSPFHARPLTPRSKRPFWIGVLLLASLALAVPMGLPFISGYHLATAQNGQLLLARTVHSNHLDSTILSPAGSKGGWPAFQGVPTYEYDFGTVTFRFGFTNASPGAGPTEAWVSELWGGSWYIAMGGPGWWVSPDGLSGIQSSGGLNVTLMVAFAEISYGLPPILGALLFAATAAIIGYASYTLVAELRRRRLGPTP